MILRQALEQARAKQPTGAPSGALQGFRRQPRFLTMTTAKTNAERQRAFRASKAAQTAAEVRGLFAHPDDHQAIREAAKRLADRLAKKRKPATPTKG